MLANLDNEVIFKKVFTDKEIFAGFVKDVLGIEITNFTIETEKRFEPKIGQIDFKLDIFAESEDDRVVVEIQRIEYDYNFDRFLHYFLMSIAQLQRNYEAYGIDKTVYGIVVMTAPYTIKTSDNKPVKNEVLISNLNPKSLDGEEVRLFNHRLVFLNAYHKDKTTPPAIRDWLDLVYQSIHSPKEPVLNTKNPLIQKAVEIIDVDNLTPLERDSRKRSESTRIARRIRDDLKKEEGMEQVIIMTIKQGKTDQEIAEFTGLPIEKIQEIRTKM